jgi:hypothetical protein
MSKYFIAIYFTEYDFGGYESWIFYVGISPSRYDNIKDICGHYRFCKFFKTEDDAKFIARKIKKKFKDSEIAVIPLRVYEDQENYRAAILIHNDQEFADSIQAKYNYPLSIFQFNFSEYRFKE